MEPFLRRQRAIEKKRILPRVSAVQTALSLVASRALSLFSPSDPSRHFTFPKVLKGLLGFIPIACGAAYIGYYLATKYALCRADSSQFVLKLESEDQIYALLDQGSPVITMHFIPGEIMSEIMTPEFNAAAVEMNQYALDSIVKFVRVNCAQHASFCRRRKMTHMPWLEIYLPPTPRSPDDKLRIRLLQEKSKYAICPYKSDLSVTGIRTALRELELVPSPDPHRIGKARLAQEFFERVYS